MSCIRQEKLQALVGREFNDKSLLQAAFTHSSYVNEHDAVSNERLEFLGDCVLNFLVGVKLFESNADAKEGSLSATRAALVSRAPLSRLVESEGYMEFLRVGAGVDKSGFSAKARSDLYEAIVGAIYLDGGLDECKAFLDRTFFGHVLPERDCKTELQEYAIGHGGEAVYETVAEGDGFVTALYVCGEKFTGRGKTKHASQIEAARAALGGLKDR